MAFWNDQTRPYKDEKGTWTDVPSDIIKDDWDRIGSYYVSYYRASGRTLFNSDGSRKTHRDPYFPPGYRPNVQTPRKQMLYSIGETDNPAKDLLHPPPEDC